MRTSFYLQGRAHLRPGPSNVTDEAEALRAIDEAGTIIGQERQFSVYTLTDVSESKVTAPFAARFTSSRRPTTYVVAGAVVGVTALQSIILRGIVQVTGRRLVARDTRAEAMEWLANEARLVSSKR